MQFYKALGLSKLAAFLPFIAAIIEKINVRIHPPQTGIHIGIPEAFGGIFQKLGSIKAERISNELIMRGTYQILLGFCLIMKKQAVADNKPKRRYAVFPPSSNECTKSSTTNNTIVKTIKHNSANHTLEVLERIDFFILSFIMNYY
jgi:hypothetical protein